jgi:N-acetylglucosamine malate deacetylase 1
MSNKVDILAFGAHPDDVELSCAGTLLKHIAAGKTVALADLTKGELGTRGSGELRMQEAEKSRQIMGAQFRECLHMKDGFFQNDENHQRQIIEIIRKYRPEIVLCNAPTDRHPDHGRAGQLVAESCFLSGLIKIETLWMAEKQEAWRPKAVYHYVQDVFVEPDFVIDVTEFSEKKLECIQAFSSQFYKAGSKDPETPISSKEFMEAVFAKMSIFGRAINARYAEGFVADRYIGVNSLFDLK